MDITKLRCQHFFKIWMTAFRFRYRERRRNAVSASTIYIKAITLHFTLETKMAVAIQATYRGFKDRGRCLIVKRRLLRLQELSEYYHFLFLFHRCPTFSFINFQCTDKTLNSKNLSSTQEKSTRDSFLSLSGQLRE